MLIDPFINFDRQVTRTEKYIQDADHAVEATIGGFTSDTTALPNSLGFNLGLGLNSPELWDKMLQLGLQIDYSHQGNVASFDAYDSDGNLQTIAVPHDEVSAEAWVRWQLAGLLRLTAYGQFQNANETAELTTIGISTPYATNESNFSVGLQATVFDTLFGFVTGTNLGNKYTVMNSEETDNYQGLLWGAGLHLWKTLDLGFMQQTLDSAATVYPNYSDRSVFIGLNKLNIKQHLFSASILYSFVRQHFAAALSWNPAWLDNMFTVTVWGAGTNLLNKDELIQSNMSAGVSLTVKLLPFKPSQTPAAQAKSSKSAGVQIEK